MALFVVHPGSGMWITAEECELALVPGDRDLSDVDSAADLLEIAVVSRPLIEELKTS